MVQQFEQTGWSQIDITAPALDQVEREIKSLGARVEPFDLSGHLPGFQTYLQLPDYAGEYQVYGGAEKHCLWEKSIEHYLSLVLAEPKPGQVAIDVGSCQSVVPDILRRVYAVRCFEQDLTYPAGVHGDIIGSSADNIPLPESSVDFMVLHCTFEHFEGTADTGFVRECARLLKLGGKVIILPLYLNANHCNITGETNEATRESIGFDPTAQYYSIIPEWQNRFGRHYSPEALYERVIKPAQNLNLQSKLLRVRSYELVDPRLWLRWILVLTKTDGNGNNEAPTQVAAPMPQSVPDRTTAQALAFAPPGHFYSPHPRLEDLETNYKSISERSRDAGGIDLNLTAQLELLARASDLKPIGPWTKQASKPHRYHYDNVMFRFGDSNAIWQITQLFKPARVIEVGSGYSTACWLDTFDLLEHKTSLTCIEPYPERIHQFCRPEDLSDRITLHQVPVQQIPRKIFTELNRDDVLFIDSTHVSKCGSDVNYLFFEILPALAPGVIVHVHDIFWPFDYPLSWYQEGRAWNECFLLRAFLQFNPAFSIIRFNSFLAQQSPEVMIRRDHRFVSDAGGSIWLKKNG